MGLNFRKSIKIAPGIKLNVSKRGIGVSAGVKGARVSVNSKGRVSKSVGIPGTGVSYRTSSKIGGKDKAGKMQDNTGYALPKSKYVASRKHNKSNLVSSVNLSNVHPMYFKYPWMASVVRFIFIVIGVLATLIGIGALLSIPPASIIFFIPACILFYFAHLFSILSCALSNTNEEVEEN